MRAFKNFFRSYRRGHFQHDKQGNLYYKSASGNTVFIGMKKNDVEETTPPPTIKNVIVKRHWIIRLLNYLKNIFK